MFATHWERPKRSRPPPERIAVGRYVWLPGIGSPDRDAAPDRFTAEIRDFVRANA